MVLLRFQKTDRTWKVTAEEIEKRSYNLNIKNPNGMERSERN